MYLRILVSVSDERIKSPWYSMSISPIGITLGHTKRPHPSALRVKGEGEGEGEGEGRGWRVRVRVEGGGWRVEGGGWRLG